MFTPDGCPITGNCGGQIFRQVMYAPEPPPEHIICRRRLPTPPPNIHEQTIVVRPPRQIIHEVVEQPVCPPPIVRTNYVMAAREAPHYSSSMVNVCPSGSNCNLAHPDLIHPRTFNTSPTLFQ